MSFTTLHLLLFTQIDSWHGLNSRRLLMKITDKRKWKWLCCVTQFSNDFITKQCRVGNVMFFFFFFVNSNFTVILTTSCFNNLFAITNSTYSPHYLKSVSAVAAWIGKRPFLSGMFCFAPFRSKHTQPSSQPCRR